MCQGSINKRAPLSPETLQAERQRLKQLLRENGHTVTSRRLAVYDVLLELNDHTCVEHILDALQRKRPEWQVNKTTVYRTLDLLQSLGLVYQMKRDDGRAQYELALYGPHGHLLCQACGRLEDLDSSQAGSFQQALRKQNGFRVDLVNHALLGLCAQCAQAHH